MSISTFQFQYASFKTALQADRALEDFIASGEVLPCEHPHIVRKPNGWYAIMVDGE